MSRAPSRTLGLFACALALGCEPGAPPNAPPPPSTASAAVLASPPPQQQGFTLKESEPLADEQVPALVEACAAGKLDDATTAALVQRLSAARDRRGEPCFVRALQDYRPDVTEETIALATDALGALKLKAASGALFEVFQKIHASKPRASKAYRSVTDAMAELLDPSWEP